MASPETRRRANVSAADLATAASEQLSDAHVQQLLSWTATEDYMPYWLANYGYVVVHTQQQPNTLPPDNTPTYLRCRLTGLTLPRTLPRTAAQHAAAARTSDSDADATQALGLGDDDDGDGGGAENVWAGLETQ